MENHLAWPARDPGRGTGAPREEDRGLQGIFTARSLRSLGEAGVRGIDPSYFFPFVGLVPVKAGRSGGKVYFGEGSRGVRSTSFGSSPSSPSAGASLRTTDSHDDKAGTASS